MKTLIINNTENFHSGSYVVNQTLKKVFKTDIILENKVKPTSKELSNYNLVVCNGEGTMHSNKARARHNLKILKQANSLGIKTGLVNTVWQNMNENIDFIDYVSVREVLSKEEMSNNRTKEIDVNLDASFYYDHSFLITPTFGVVYGAGFENSSLNIFEQSWDYIVNTLKNSKLLITKRHHEMYAACKAKCPFLVYSGNTHKNEGLLKTFNSNIPILDENSDINYYIKHYQDYNNDFDILFSSMHNTRLNLQIQ